LRGTLNACSGSATRRAAQPSEIAGGVAFLAWSRTSSVAGQLPLARDGRSVAG
jgi:NAD(P)-dependent dehydrogenase (short-subunit alcohol dehydrogenase family)